jgi:hypothetical protein
MAHARLAGQTCIARCTFAPEETIKKNPNLTVNKLTKYKAI